MISKIVSPLYEQTDHKLQAQWTFYRR